MKSYVIQIEKTDKQDKQILMLIIEALAKQGIVVSACGIQQVNAITLSKKKGRG